METYLTITPHDPIIARDGRPFGISQRRMHSLNWPYPSVLAGSLRTMLGKLTGADFRNKETIAALKNVSVSGPLPLWEGKLFFPAPKDLLVQEDENARYAYALRPMKMREENDGRERGGCDLPKGDLLPTLLPKWAPEFKPGAVPPFWSAEMITNWLKNPTGENFKEPPKTDKVEAGGEFLLFPQRDSRVHIMISPDLGSSEEGMLFLTVGLDFSLKGRSGGIQLAARVDAEGIFEKDLEKVDSFGTIGGERRLAHWKAETNDYSQKGWSFPKEIRLALEDQKKKTDKQKVRLVLATPAVFSQGWLPGWLRIEGDSIVGAPPGSPPGMKLKLVSASLDRWRPISGWSLECRKNGPRPGPKSIRRLVPAGAVYFFEVLSGDGAKLAESLWLRSVSDNEIDELNRCDGFGLALWGVWDFYEDEQRGKLEV